MSLLIKALNKAEAAQAQNAKGELAELGRIDLALSPILSNNTDAIPSLEEISDSSLKPSPKRAANIFSAKGIESKTYETKNSETKRIQTTKNEISTENKNLAIIGGAGLIALIAISAYFYHALYSVPETVIAQRPVLPQTQVIAPLPATLEKINPVNDDNLPAIIATQTSVAQVADSAPINKPSAFEAKVALLDQLPVKKISSTKVENMDDVEALATNDSIIEANADESEAVDGLNKNMNAGKNSARTKKKQFGSAIASDSASISVTKSSPQSNINPVLMSAYEAYNAGNDTNALKLYRQVLQRDIRNVDALLGMGAIAQRQGRLNDAQGWYTKVLELEPRNSMAQSAMLDINPQNDDANNESRLKSMLAKQPEDANLHAALGNLYADKNQWAAAQQDYFEAYRLMPSADNAFNLAVSLDQMGKSTLALPYYQRALQLMQQSGTSYVDKAALEARIAVIQ